MVLWLFVYRGGVFSAHMSIAPQYWHGHEMVFGYSMAVVAGFLLTAVGNWTGKKPCRADNNFILFGCRGYLHALFSLFYHSFLWLGVLADIVFTILFF